MTLDEFCEAHQTDPQERLELRIYLAFLRFRALFAWLMEEP